MKTQPFVIFTIFSILAFATFSNAQIIDQSSCAEDDMYFAENATNCLDEDPVACGIIFVYGDERDPKCENPSLYVEALKCANTCLACCLRPAFSCSNDPTSPIDCNANARLCKNSNWTSVMDKYCPSTCGTCLTSKSCKDTIPGCRDNIQLCNDVKFYTYMTEKCTRTCNRCNSSTSLLTTTTTSPSTTTCSDTATNCLANKSLCNNSVYYTLMTEKCPKTCSRCPLSTSNLSITCIDTNSNCGNWVKNGFCSNTFYTLAQKRSYCARSCNLC